MTQESDDIYLLAEVATLYYEENYNQEQIAKMIGVSRSGVSRLLTRSREVGLVDIHVHQPLRTSIALRDALMNRFGLKDAQVLLSASSSETILGNVGALAARFLDRKIQGAASTREDAHKDGHNTHNARNTQDTDGTQAIQNTHNTQTVGISWGTAMVGMLKELRPRQRIPINVVQLMGSIGTNSLPEGDGPEIARRLASAYGGMCYYLHAPLLVTSSAVRDGLLQERNLHRSFEMMKQMDIAVVGIGGIRSEASGLFRAGYLNENELQVVRSKGAVGDICGWYFDSDGHICETEMLDRTIAVPFETLQRVPLVIAVAAGNAKANTVLGALRSGVVDVLITDELCAQEAIEIDSK